MIRAWITGFLFLVAASAQQASPLKCVFAGVVQDSLTGRRLPRSRVTVRSTTQGKPTYGTVTDSAGAFRFEAIEAGDYRIWAQESEHAFGAVYLKPGQAVSMVHCAAGQSISGAVVALDPQAVITGRVTDADGEPIAGAQVALLQEHWMRGTRDFLSFAQTTDERGEYRFQQVPGRYYVGAGVPGDGAVPAVFSAGPGKPEMRIAPRVYPNSAGVEGATPLDVRPGQQYGGIDLHLPTVAAYRVRGAVRPWGSWTGPKSLYLVRREGGGGGFDSMLALDKDGGFEAAGVLPGNYWLQSLAVSMVGASVAVEVTDRDVEGVVFPLLPPVEVKGHLRFDEDGAHDLSKMHIRLTRLDTGHLLGEADAEIEAGETFQFHRLAAAQTALEMTPPSDYFLQSATYNQRPVESGVLDLTAATTGELEIVVGSGTGTVTGTLRDMTRRAAAVLAPAAGVTGNTGVRSADIDPNGGFRFPFVPPGRYYIWAVANFDPDHWQNMDFVTQMQQSGTAVEVEKKGTAQVEIRAVIE